MDGSINSTLTIDTTLFVKVTVGDGTCYNSDSINTYLVPAASMLPLRSDTSICESAGDEILIEVVDQNVKVEWQDGTTTETYTANKSGKYVATITDINNCMAKDSVLLSDSCGTVVITIPNIFTPTRTGTPLKPIEEPTSILSVVNIIDFTVYNRWGMVMFHSEGVLPNWDGFDISRKKPCSSGVYFWILNYQDYDDGVHKLNGFVELLRPK